jgi:hypothetical protein
MVITIFFVLACFVGFSLHSEMVIYLQIFQF